MSFRDCRHASCIVASMAWCHFLHSVALCVCVFTRVRTLQRPSCSVGVSKNKKGKPPRTEILLGTWAERLRWLHYFFLNLKERKAFEHHGFRPVRLKEVLVSTCNSSFDSVYIDSNSNKVMSCEYWDHRFYVIRHICTIFDCRLSLGNPDDN